MLCYHCSSHTTHALTEDQYCFLFNVPGFSSPATNSRHMLDVEKGNTVRRALFSSLGESDSHKLEGPSKTKQQVLTREAPTRENGKIYCLVTLRRVSESELILVFICSYKY